MVARGSVSGSGSWFELGLELGLGIGVVTGVGSIGLADARESTGTGRVGAGERVLLVCVDRARDVRVVCVAADAEVADVEVVEAGYGVADVAVLRRARES